MTSLCSPSGTVTLLPSSVTGSLTPFLCFLAKRSVVIHSVPVCWLFYALTSGCVFLPASPLSSSGVEEARVLRVAESAIVYQSCYLPEREGSTVDTIWGSTRVEGRWCSLYLWKWWWMISRKNKDVYVEGTARIFVGKLEAFLGGQAILHYRLSARIILL